MQWTAMAQVVVIGAGVGFGAYCLTCALHVWRSRNASLRGGARAEPRSGARRTAAVLAVGGLAGMLLSALWQAAVPREGLLSGDGLFTVRRLAEFDVAEVASSKVVAKDDLLVRVHSPAAEAEIAVLELRRESLAAERGILLHQPLAVDPEITQKLAELNAQERTWRTNLNDLVLEKERLLRDRLRERLAKQDEINKLHREESRLRGDWNQAQGDLALCREEHDRLAKLRLKDVTGQQEYSQKANELASRQIEVRKLDEQLQKVAAQREGIERGLDDYLAFSRDQEKQLTGEILRLEARLDDVARGQKEFEQRRDDDLARAKRHREQSLKKIDVERKQADRQLAGWKRRLEIPAPFAGRIVYRATSPGSVKPEEPLVVLAPVDGLRFSVRLPRWMQSPLRDAGGVSCKLLEDLERDDQRRFVDCRFTARLAGWEDLPSHPGYGLAELKCEAPAEAVRLLARGEQIAASLIWRPPWHTDPVFLLSALVAAAAGLPWAVSRRRARPAFTEGRLPSRAAGNGRHVPCDIATEFGAEGAMLHLLGSQLREMIAGGDLDAGVVAAAEWALDRHRARAVRLLALGMGDGAELCEHLERLVQEHAANSGNGRPRPGSSDLLRRLIAVLRTVAPAPGRERLRRIARELPRLGPARSNGRKHYAEAAEHQG